MVDPKFRAFEKKRKVFTLLLLGLLLPALLFTIIGYATPWWFQTHIRISIDNNNNNEGGGGGGGGISAAALDDDTAPQRRRGGGTILTTITGAGGKGAANGVGSSRLPSGGAYNAAHINSINPYPLDTLSLLHRTRRRGGRRRLSEYELVIKSMNTDDGSSCPGSVAFESEAPGALLSGFKRAGLFAKKEHLYFQSFPARQKAYAALSKKQAVDWDRALLQSSEGIPIHISGKPFRVMGVKLSGMAAGGDSDAFLDEEEEEEEEGEEEDGGSGHGGNDDPAANMVPFPLIEFDGGLGLFELCYSVDEVSMLRMAGLPLAVKACANVLDMCAMVEDSDFSLVAWLNTHVGSGGSLPAGLADWKGAPQMCTMLQHSLLLGSLLLMAQIAAVLGVTYLVFCRPTLCRFGTIALLLLLAVGFAIGSADEYVQALYLSNSGLNKILANVSDGSAPASMPTDRAGLSGNSSSSSSTTSSPTAAPPGPSMKPLVETTGTIGYSAALVATAAALQILALFLLLAYYCVTKDSVFLAPNVDFNKLRVAAPASVWRSARLGGGGGRGMGAVQVKRRQAPEALLEDEYSDGLGEEAVWAR